MTNHHPNCQHYNDSLIDVWRVTFGGQTYITTNEKDAVTEAQEAASEGDEIRVTKERMHRELFEALPEFNGF